ncbi:MAG: hypothetical protein C4581_01355 [Nitrospiraceae bacterium]|nr:MAG: hypothetical protein C4581_01355 [Nitrospiraceae bacterium]
MRRCLLSIIFIIASIEIQFYIPASALAQDEPKTYVSNCCTILYSDARHVHYFTQRIGGFKYTSTGLDDNPLNVKKRVDEIMGKVQSTLDMYPSDFHISIMLVPDYQTAEKIFRQFSTTGNVPLAFYSNKTKTIYVNVDSVTVGVLAHEMAHAVINFYFEVPPPAKMQEILAQYVDIHIWD